MPKMAGSYEKNGNHRQFRLFSLARTVCGLPSEQAVCRRMMIRFIKSMNGFHFCCELFAATEVIWRGSMNARTCMCGPAVALGRGYGDAKLPCRPEDPAGVACEGLGRGRSPVTP